MPLRPLGPDGRKTTGRCAVPAVRAVPAVPASGVHGRNVKKAKRNDSDVMYCLDAESLSQQQYEPEIPENKSGETS